MPCSGLPLLVMSYRELSLSSIFYVDVSASTRANHIKQLTCLTKLCRRYVFGRCARTMVNSVTREAYWPRPKPVTGTFYLMLVIIIIMTNGKRQAKNSPPPLLAAFQPPPTHRLTAGTMPGTHTGSLAWAAPLLACDPISPRLYAGLGQGGLEVLSRATHT